MSFIYEDENIKKLIEKLAQVPVQEFPESYPSGAGNADSSRVKDVSLKLLKNLKQSYSGISSDENLKLFQKNIFNLKALLLWLAEKKVAVNGHAVVYTKQDQIAENDKQIRYVGKFPEPLVWREGLVEILKNLRAQSAESGNLYFQELVAQLIEDANTNPSYDAGLDANEPKAQEKPKDPNDFSDVEEKPEEIVDTISSRINPKYDIAEDLQITVRDLLDNNFPSLVSKLFISLDGSNNYSPVKWDDENYTCKALNYLYQRAREKQSKNKNVRKFEFYAKQVYKFMGQKHCPIAPADPTAEDQKPNTAPNQKQVDQIAYKQVSDSVHKSLEQGGGSSDLILPFELTTDLISIDRFRHFLMQASSLTTNPSFNAEMGTFINVLRSQAYAVDTLLRNWQHAAIGTAAIDGGFSLNGVPNVSDFTQTFANADYSKAREMLLILSPICTQLAGVVNVLRASPTMTQIVGGDHVLRDQVQRGKDYVDRIGSLITQINNLARR